MTASVRLDEGATIHGILSACPEQRLAAAIIGQAVDDAIMHPHSDKRSAAYHWLMTNEALSWMALITPEDLTPRDLQRMAVVKARTGRRAKERQ